MLRAGLLWLGLLLLAGAARADTGPAAVVTDLQGQARFRAASGWKDLEFLARLSVGSVVEVRKGRLVLSFTRGGGRVEVTAPARVTVEASGVRPAAGSAGHVKAGRPMPKGVAVLPSDVDFDRMAGKVRGVVQVTGDAGARPERPVLRWTHSPQREYAEYEVVVSRMDPSGAERRVVKQVVPGSARALALPPLEPGIYLARVTASAVPGAAGDVSPDFRMEVLPPARCAELGRVEAAWAAEKAAGGTDASMLVLLVREYVNLGIYGDAREAAAELEALRPGNPLSAEVARSLAR